MGLYDCMYLVPRDQYKSGSLQSGVDGIGGDVQASKVTNIEVGDGSTVVFGEKEKEEERRRSETEFGTRKKQSKKSDKNVGLIASHDVENNERDDDDLPQHEIRLQPPPSPLKHLDRDSRLPEKRRSTSINPGGNKRLRMGGIPIAKRRAGDTSLRRKTLMSNHKKLVGGKLNNEKQVMKELIHDRLNQLQGKNRGVKERRIIHQLRDQYKTDLKSSLGKRQHHPDEVGWKRMKTFHHQQMSGKKRSSSHMHTGTPVNKKVKMYHYFPEVGGKRKIDLEHDRAPLSKKSKFAGLKRPAIDDLDEGSNVKKSKSYHYFPKAGHKRPYDEDGSHLETMDFIYDPPSSKKSNKKKSRIRAVGKFAGIKRKVENNEEIPMDLSDQNEYKKSRVTFDD